MARYRTLTEAFRTHLDNDGALPPVTPTLKRMREVCRTRTDTLTRLHGGNLVKGKFARAYFIALLRSRNDPRFHKTLASLLSFVRARGVESLSPDRLDAIVGHTCTQLIDRPDGRVVRDFLPRGVRALFDSRSVNWLHWHVRACDKAEHISDAVSWMYSRVAQEMAGDGPSMMIPEAKDFSGRFMGIDYEGYVRKASTWKAKNPWSVLRAWDQGAPVGMTIVLPVTEVVYEAIRRGDVASYDTPADSLLPHSTYLIVEAVAENPDALTLVDPEPTEGLNACLAIQV